VIPTDTITAEDAPDLRRRRITWLAIGAAALLLLWTVVGVVRLLDARNHALSGLAELEAIRGRVDVDTVTEGGLVDPLVNAWDDFRTAQERIRSPFVAPLRLVPWMRTQVQSAEALSSSASAVTGALTAAATEAANLAEVANSLNRAAVAGETLAVVRRTQVALSTVDLGPTRLLIGSLAEARDRFALELAEAQQLLYDVELVAAGMAEFLEGPTSYLLLAANNAEMRAGTGSYLQVGVVRIENGTVTVEELQSAGDILLERGAVTVADADLQARWGWLDMTVDWRNLSPSPRFPANAAIAADMWEALREERMDGVIVLDPVGLGTLMGVTGPVEVEGRRIDADRVVRELLFDQYWEDDVAERRDRLEEIAASALSSIDRAEVDLVTLAQELQEAVAARHLLAWSRLPSQQRAWETIGVAGVLSSDSLAVALLNRGANKLDPFLTIQAEIDVQEVESDQQVSLRLSLENVSQVVFPSYVLGPANALGYELGTYVGILSVNVPGRAVGARFVGVDDLATEGPDGDTQVLAVFVEVPAGSTLERELVFTLPGSDPQLRIEPSARVPGIAWTAAATDWIDSSPVVLDLATGIAAGDAVGRPAQPISFELDPIRNPTAPLPAVAFDPTDETTVEVLWQPLPENPAVDIWEKEENGEWEQVAEAITTAPLGLPGRPRNTELCYRTALSIAPDQFSAVECLTIPAAVGYMQFTGDPASYFAAADFVGTGSVDIRALVAPDRWVPEYWQMFAGQYDSAGNDRAWRFGIDVFDALIANYSADGRSDLGSNGFLPSSFRDGSREWVRVTIDLQAGEQQFWISETGQRWSPLGEARTFDILTALHDSGGPVFVGTDRRGSENPYAGKLYYLEIRNGIAGQVIANLDFRTLDQREGSDGRWIDDFGNVFEGVGSAWSYTPPDG
jgi:hypothetical protein